MKTQQIVFNRNSRDMMNDEAGALCRDTKTNTKIESLIYAWKYVTLGIVLGTNTDLHVGAGRTWAPLRFRHVHLCPRSNAPRLWSTARGPGRQA